MSADVGLNADLLRLADRRDPERVSTAAHEIGHGLGELLGEGTAPQWVKLNPGLFWTSGWCQWGEMPSRDWPRERRVAHLVSTMAGHAAGARFCRVYAGMDEQRAFKYARNGADGDYADFYHWRSKLGLFWSGVRPEWAFEQATALLETHAEALDALTVRLDAARYLPGSDLAAAVTAGRGRKWKTVRRPVDGMKVRVGDRPEPREHEPREPEREPWTRRLRDRIQGREDRREQLADLAAADWADDPDFDGEDDLITRVVEALTEYLSWEDAEERTG
ncbi:MAG: hypothetical protein J2P20_00100 [Pseudonocardia sp.]|nr:hypothetical protein [Pseudonocardia sp.]